MKPRRATYRHGNLKSAALKAATRLVAAAGHEQLSLREVAEAEGALRPELERLAAPMFAAFLDTIERGQRAGEFRAADARHVANILSGAAIWLLTGAQMLGGGDAEPRERRLAQHRDELVGVARHLLGVETPGAVDSGG